MDAMTIFGLPGAVCLALAATLAASCDLLYRRIPNPLTVALLGLWGLFCLWAAVSVGRAGFPPTGLVFGVGCSAAVLIGGYALFCLGALGAGDVKFAAVSCLWLGEEAVAFLLATALAGGLMILQLPMLRRVEMVLASLVMRMPGPVGATSGSIPAILLREDAQGVPYGPAIAAGIFVALMRTWA
ncbi:hypothetical protein GKC30_12915 [Pseudodesulfovibrio sp. F-1]|uniref:Prepilin type IV endopeptidase peptidase domain-containing protein n=1 Tax=Pseudodesulfovibrio alkaliphilus TaxID=2661613 RepID=A0A7K1KR22_9BACT|nr:prepilin peptidase [Pseudodesulfovibrio alkaliphilus]MUM78538.1 hypothetical protein [Pseudodesulfovibrio alkaliphilus]